MAITAFRFPELTTPKPRISFVIDNHLKQELEAQALSESRTVSNLVLLAVREYLDKAKSDRTKSKGAK